MTKIGYEQIGTQRCFQINGKIISLPELIVTWNSRVILEHVVAILVSSKKLNFCHVWCISFQGEIVWKFNEDNYLSVSHPFRSMYVDSKGDLWLINLAGAHYRVDPKTGESKEVKYKNMDFKIVKKKGIFTSDKVVFPNGKEIKVREGVHSYYCYQGEVLVVIENKFGKKAANAVAYNKDGEQLWHFVGPETVDGDQCNYVFTKAEGEDLWIDTWLGWKYKIEPHTGKVIDEDFHK